MTQMPKYHVRATWQSTHTIEVDDDDFHNNCTYLNNFPDNALEEITSHGAELTDWEVIPID